MENKSIYQQAQRELLSALVIPDNGEGYRMQEQDVLVSLDVQYKRDWGFVAMDLMTWPGPDSYQFLAQIPVEFPYEPGYFAFREGPVLQAAVERLMVHHNFRPNLLVVDGHGTAHPRKMGLASWLGIRLGIPSIGVAKEPLLKIPYDLEEEVGASEAVCLKEELVGYVLRTQTGVKPLFVSSGHLVSQAEALRIAMQLRGEYRVLAPIRRADLACRRFAKGEAVPQAVELKKATESNSSKL